MSRLTRPEITLLPGASPAVDRRLQGLIDLAAALEAPSAEALNRIRALLP